MWKRALRLLIAIILAVFAVETGVMLLIDYIFRLSATVETILDSLLLVTILFPFLYFLVFRPLTEEIERREQERKLRTGLAQMVVHDLRNPLTTIESVVALYVSQAGKQMSEQESRLLKALTISEKRLSALIDNILHLGAMRDGTLSIDPAVVPVHDICKDLEWLDVLADHERKRLVRCEGCEDMKVVADQRLITRVLENLLVNSFKHTREGDEIHLEIIKDDDRIRFEVHDNGEGIPHEYLEHIFDSMFTMDRAGRFRQAMSSGTGLGLAFCKMAVEAHNAELRVESEPGKRTSFWFALPAGY